MRLTGFAQPEPGRPQLAKEVAARILEGEGAVDLPQPQRANTGFGQPDQRIGRSPAAPDRQLPERRISLVDPAIAIRVEGGKIAETIPTLGAKQFVATIGTAIAVAVQHQISTAASEAGQTVLFAITIEIESDPFAAQFGSLAGEVEHQRVLQHDTAILIPGSLGAFTARQGHFEIEGDATPIGRFDLARTTDLQMLAFRNDLAPLRRPRLQPGRGACPGLFRQTAIAIGRAAFPAFECRQDRFQQLLEHACETFAWAGFGLLQLHLFVEYLPETAASTEFDAVLALRLMVGCQLDFG